MRLAARWRSSRRAADVGRASRAGSGDAPASGAGRLAGRRRRAGGRAAVDESSGEERRAAAASPRTSPRAWAVNGSVERGVGEAN